MFDEKAMSSIVLHLYDKVIYQIYGLKMDEGGDVIAHLNDFNWCITLLLLRYLPESFKHFRTTLLFDKDNLECDAVVSDIISYVKINKASKRKAQGERSFAKDSNERG
ncbi:hypothetical protein ACOSQ3_010564 [Xanthoceras sorbifolium]